jgi:hypothetical protein
MSESKRICPHGRWNDQCPTCNPYTGGNKVTVKEIAIAMDEMINNERKKLKRD